jgi:microcystin-dependent protein
MSYTKNSITILIPTGGIVAYTGVINVNTPPPAGWLLCDGTVYSRTTYSALYNVIGTAYNTTTTSDTDFNVPNFQAAFLRGAGTQTYPTGEGGTTYGGSAINTAQETATLTHSHNYTSTATNHNHSFTTTTHGHTYTNTGGHAHTTPNVAIYWPNPQNNKLCGFNTSSGRLAYNMQTDTTFSTSNISVADQSTGVSLGNTDVSFNSDNNTTNSTPNETIPFNYAINWIIKY